MNNTSISHWRSYINTPDYPEYPSATASFCSNIAEVAKNWWKDGDAIGPQTTKIVHQSQRNEYLISPQSVPLQLKLNRNGMNMDELKSSADKEGKMS